MNDCFSTLLDVVSSNRPGVLVTVAHIAGSAPREAGARMIVTPAQVLGTIGGGNLEYEAIRIARSRLDGPQTPGSQRFIELFPLGSMLQQCCGGAVFLHFDVIRDGQSDWVSVAAASERNNTPALLVSRTSLTEKMIFTETGITGSLGDKDLDELATAKAAALLSAQGPPQTSLLHSPGRDAIDPAGYIGCPVFRSDFTLRFPDRTVRRRPRGPRPGECPGRRHSLQHHLGRQSRRAVSGGTAVQRRGAVHGEPGRGNR